MQRIHTTHTKVLTAFAVLAMLLSASLVLAQGPGSGKGLMGCKGPGQGSGHGPGFGPGMTQGGMPAMMVEKLGLSTDQQTAIKEIHTQARQDNLELRKQMMRLRNELQGEMLKDDPTENKVLDLTQKIGAVRTEMQKNRVQARLAVRKQLTSEQRDMMLTMGPGHHQGRGGSRGHGGRGGFAGRGGHGCQGCSGPGQGPGFADD